MVKVTREEIDFLRVYETGLNKVREDLNNLLKKTLFSDSDSINSIISLLNNIKAKRLEQINTILNRTDYDEVILVKLQKERKILNVFTPSDLRCRVTRVIVRLDLRKIPEIKGLIVFYGL